MALTPRLVVLVSLASGVWLGGASTARADCKDDSECKSPRICDAGVCREPQCTADADCLSGQACERGRCAARTGACKSDAECPGDQLCVESACRAEPACKSDVECPGDSVCTMGRCGAGTTKPSTPSGPVPTGAPPGPPPATAPPVWPGAPGPGPSAGAAEPDKRGGSKGALIFGGAQFGAAYLISLPVTAAASHGRATGDAAIPLVGPIVIMANGSTTDEGKVYYTMDCLVQGIGLFFVGLGIANLGHGGDPKSSARQVRYPWSALLGGDAEVRVSTLAPDGRGPGIGLGVAIP